jgi:predicted TIM-barrel fold metal-dependent hydrolase
MIIDCDVHNDWSSADVLLPYMDPNFRDYFQRGEKPGPQGALPHAHRPWLHPEDFRRHDIKPESDDDHYKLMRQHLLDKYDITIAILTGEEALECSTLANPHYASAIARAFNDWLIHEWLPRDPRFKGSLLVAPQDPQGAAAEIRRLGDHKDIVQVLMSHGSYRPYGDPFYHPIWEAAAEVGLPIAIHLGGQGGINYQPIGGGPTTFYWTTHALLCQPAMSHVASTIAHGVFEKWPKMKFIIIECGIAWLPAILWRLDANYKALRKETPWLKRLPSEYARDHIRLTTQPLEQPARKEDLWHVLEAIDGRHVLMYASDYPHWDFDDPTQIRLPREWQEDIFYKNALQTYDRLPKLAE